MTQITDDHDFEHHIRIALRDRAATYTPSDDPPASVIRRSRPRAGRSVLVAAIVVTLVVVAAAALVTRHSDNRNDPSSQTEPATTQPGPAPTGAGPEVALQEVPATAALQRTFLSNPLAPGSTPVVFRVAGGALAMISTQLVRPSNLPELSLNVLQGDNNGVSGTGGDRSVVMQTFYYPNPPHATPVQVIYAWSGAPDGTAYVTLTSDRVQEWQRPQHGIVIFAIDDGPIAGTLRAFDNNGQQLAETTFPKLDNGKLYPLPTP